jgi:hypothetical protein
VQQLTAQKDTRPCLICSKEGTRHPVEVLPDGGILFMVAHENGQICKWAEYASIFDVAKPKKRKGGIPTYIICPKCGERGRLNWAYDIHAVKEERPFTFKYIVVHERVPGTWGKVKLERRRRCQSFTPEQRIAILKQVGRYIADPPKPPRENILKKLDGYDEPLFQKHDENPNLTISNNNASKNDMSNSKMEEALSDSKQKISRVQLKDTPSQIQYKGLVPRGKRLTICIKCNKPGYKYPTYFQHYNEPPIGKVILKGRVIGDRYRRCYITKQKVNQEEDNVRQNADSIQIQKEKEMSPTGVLKKELGRYVDEISSSSSKEENTRKDYKKMYWDLVEKLRKIVNDTNHLNHIF